ncbi:MAG TPA: hypothetical protein VJP80_02300 [Candidatus Saccharimonadales bacterium]|nr:hypothetical protein [Candidatus Saccharimonadales bacterium]
MPTTVRLLQIEYPAPIVELAANDFQHPAITEDMLHGPSPSFWQRTFGRGY